MTDLIIFSSLLIINLIFIVFSNRKRKYGLFSSKIFILLFISYWVYYMWILKYNHNAQVQGLSQQVVSNNKLISASTYFSSQNIQKETTINKHLSILSSILKAATFQASLVVLFAIIGLLTVSNRLSYYKSILIIHILFLILCVVIILL